MFRSELPIGRGPGPDILDAGQPQISSTKFFLPARARTRPPPISRRALGHCWTRLDSEFKSRARKEQRASFFRCARVPMRPSRISRAPAARRWRDFKRRPTRRAPGHLDSLGRGESKARGLNSQDSPEVWTARRQRASTTPSMPARCALGRGVRACGVGSLDALRTRCRGMERDSSRRRWGAERGAAGERGKAVLAARLCVGDTESRAGVRLGEALALDLRRPCVLGVARQKDRAWTRLDSWSRGRARYHRFCRRLCLNRSEQKPAQKRICR